MFMSTWPCHIYHFKRKYDKAFAKDPLSGGDFMDRIHKRIQMFLHSCNTITIEDVESGTLTEFGGLQKKLTRGKWLTSTPGWVDRIAPKEEGLRKSDGHGMGERPSGRGGGRDAVFNNRVDP